MEIYFPEYKDAFGKEDGAFCMEVLKTAPFPEDIRALGTDGIRNIWHEAKLRGRGYSRAALILKMAQDSVGLKGGTAAAEQKVKWLAEMGDISRFDDVKEIQKLSGLGLVAVFFYGIDMCYFFCIACFCIFYDAAHGCFGNKFIIRMEAKSFVQIIREIRSFV
ncbi:MAG: hypothetical protein LUH14_04670 [Clostridiaceae bacterium]|nr:hypothetical protein [Clostridiaceae bacterium]